MTRTTTGSVVTPGSGSGCLPALLDAVRLLTASCAKIGRMSIRSWQANASAQIELDGKVWPVVTQEDLIKALVDGAILLDRAGGCLQVVLQRQRTPMPNEMITVAAVVVWMDRTNAKAQPESPGLEVVEPAPVEGES